jgi:hypothetical protein
LGKVTSQDPDLLIGVMALAEYFKLKKLTEELKILMKRTNYHPHGHVQI